MTEELQPTSISSTICLNCIFADYNKKNIQTGCKANRLELFENTGHEIKNVTIDDKTCFVLEGKACVYYRNNVWSQSQYNTKNTKEIVKKVKQELKIPYHAILFFRQTDTLVSLKERLTELENQDIKPKMVSLIDRSHGVKSITGELMKIFQDYNFDYWRVQTIPAIDQLDNDIIDLAYDNTKKHQYMFYITLECGHKIPHSMSKDIHRSLHDEMKSFVVLLPNKNNVGKTVLKVAHQKYAGNSFGIQLEDKIVHYDDAPHLIKKVEEICPSLQ